MLTLTVNQLRHLTIGAVAGDTATFRFLTAGLENWQAGGLLTCN
ncbi:MAG TPA: hypothetical protein VFV96_05280 [Verrucomicrobiae bacterium]|nr:hypothetical protein [Verrucomicrobiae bacterium]